MTQITISLTIAIDGADLATALDKLAAIGRGARWFTETAETPQRVAEENRETPSATLCEPSADSVNPVPPPKPQNAPKRHRATSRPPKTPATLRTPVLPPIPAATINGEPQRRDGVPEEKPEEAAAPRKHSGDRAQEAPAFDAFDKLVRAEMKRLAMDGRIPGAKLWDSERDPRLPTLGAVLQRYGTSNLAGLAEALGMEPPLTAKNYTVSVNGANAIYAKEATP
ncbi:MAG: hypothetical protein E6Q97_14170 [Desulfurellales bacterium]|nr:MAG: hypothetical protein E6Q97_14170 [Desulfurellales bacterium]